MVVLMVVVVSYRPLGSLPLPSTTSSSSFSSLPIWWSLSLPVRDPARIFVLNFSIISRLSVDTPQVECQMRLETLLMLISGVWMIDNIRIHTDCRHHWNAIMHSVQSSVPHTTRKSRSLFSPHGSNIQPDVLQRGWVDVGVVGNVLNRLYTASCNKNLPACGMICASQFQSR